MRLKLLLATMVLLGVGSVSFHTYRIGTAKRAFSSGRNQQPLHDPTPLRKEINEKEQWLARYPDNLAVRDELARLYFIRQDFPRCIAHLRVLQSQRPADALVHVRLSMALSYHNQHDGALQHIQKAMKIDPKNMAAKEWLAEIYVMEGRSDEALSLFNECLKHDPSWYAALIGKSQSLEQLYASQRPVSIPSIVVPVEKAVRLQPGKSQGLVTLARMSFMYLQQFQRAERLARQAMGMDPENPQPYLILVEVYLAQPDPVRLIEAAALAQKAAALDSHNPEPLYLLARVQWRQNQIGEAIESLEKSLRIRSMPESIYLLSQAYSRVGERRKARAYQAIYKEWTAFIERRKVLMAELQHRPHDVDVYCRFAQLYLSTGDLQPAENWLRKALRLKKNNSRVQQLLTEIEKEKRKPTRRPPAVTRLLNAPTP